MRELRRLFRVYGGVIVDFQQIDNMLYLEELASEERLEDICNWSGRSRCSGAVALWTRSDGVTWPLCETHTRERDRLERRLVREYPNSVYAGGQS